MSPIAPRYRGPNASPDDIQPTVNPVLTIPNMVQPIENTVTFQGEVSQEPASPAEGEASPTPDLEIEPIAADDSGMQPVLGSMQDSIKRITEATSRSIRQVGNNKSFNPVETVRGVLPGIVISISIICLWWIVGRNSSAPTRPDIARQPPRQQETINPIASEPLRVAEQVVDASRDEAPAIATEPKRDEQLFDSVPFINRPANDRVSQSDPTQEAASTVPPANERPQAETHPAPSQSSRAPAAQSEVANAQTSARVPARQPRNERPRVNERVRPKVADRSTEFEWQRGRSGQPMIDRPGDGIRPRQDHTVTAQSPRRDRPRRDRQTQQPHSYQQTDPSTYKDPVYNVPPVARRARSAQR